MPIKQHIVVPENLADQRADIVLAELLGITRSAAAQLLTAQGVYSAERKTAYTKATRLHAGEELVVDGDAGHIAEDSKAEYISESLPILRDDPDFVVVDKPAGVAAHASPGWLGPTVVAELQKQGYRLAPSGVVERNGIVHRLDVGTSGAMVVAKTEKAYSALKRAFKEREVQKKYHALVQGLPEPLAGVIDAPIARHPHHDWRFAVVEGGRPSVTHYRVVEAFGKAALADIDLETGRTHQIRVHFSALGHPCCGDLSYGADPRLAAALGLTRQWLHAVQLGFAHPITGEPVEVQSPYPEDLAYALQELRQ